MTHDTEPGPTTSGRHPVNLLHLVAGLLFAGVVGIWVLVETGLAGLDDTRWLLPLPWLVAGAVGLVVALSGSRRESR